MLTKINAVREKLQPFALLAVRLAVGLIFAVHGWQKIQNPEKFIGLITNLGLPMPVLNAWAAIASEFVGGILIMIGLFTPIAALMTAGTMAVAILTVHWSNGLLASNNGFE